MGDRPLVDSVDQTGDLERVDDGVGYHRHFDRVAQDDRIDGVPVRERILSTKIVGMMTNEAQEETR